MAAAAPQQQQAGQQTLARPRKEGRDQRARAQSKHCTNSGTHVRQGELRPGDRHGRVPFACTAPLPVVEHHDIDLSPVVELAGPDLALRGVAPQPRPLPAPIQPACASRRQRARLGLHLTRMLPSAGTRWIAAGHYSSSSRNRARGASLTSREDPAAAHKPTTSELGPLAQQHDCPRN